MSPSHRPISVSRPSRRHRYLAVCRSRRAWIAFALLWLFGHSFAAEDSDAVMERRERDLDAIERQVQNLGQELIGRNAERQALIKELEERERDVAALAIAGRELDQLVREQTRVAEELRARQAEEQQALKAELVRLSELVRAAYVMGRADGLRMLLNQEDPLRASRIISYFVYFNRERVGRIQAVEARAERLALLAGDAEREAARLVDLAKQQDATRTRLIDAKRERAAVLADLERAISTGEEDVASLRQDAENLRLLVEHLRQRAQIRAELDVQQEPFAQRRGRLAWPLLEGRVRAAFGSPRVGSGLVWDGVLLAAREGEEVRAVYNGRVVYADWLTGFGMLLVIDHGDGYMTLYGHNEALLKEVGEWVSANEVVALSGNSGGRGDAMLYFAIRRNGEPLDPAAWCG